MRRSVSVLVLNRMGAMRFDAVCVVASAVLTPLSLAQAPTFEITPQDSTVTFSVKASISIAGKFDK